MEKSHTYGGVIVYSAPSKVKSKLHSHFFYYNILILCLVVLICTKPLSKDCWFLSPNEVALRKGRRFLWLFPPQPPEDLSKTHWGTVESPLPFGGTLHKWHISEECYSHVTTPCLWLVDLGAVAWMFSLWFLCWGWTFLLCISTRKKWGLWTSGKPQIYEHLDLYMKYLVISKLAQNLSKHCRPVSAYQWPRYSHRSPDYNFYHTYLYCHEV